MSTPANADSSVGPRVKIDGISRTALSRLHVLLQVRHWNAETSLEPLLRRAGALQQACAAPRPAAGYLTAIEVLVERWGSSLVDDLNYETVVGWYQQLQTADGPGSGKHASEINDVLVTALRTAAVERDAGGQVTAMTHNLLAVWLLKDRGANPTNAIASSLLRRSGRSGTADSLAMSLPAQKSMDLWMVSGQLHFSDSLGLAPKLLWSCDSSQVESVRKAPRLQLLSRVTIRFADGSRASFMSRKRYARAAARILASH